MTRTVAVSVGHDTAATIALDVLRDGGNATDAGIAASIALCVLHSEQVQLGGVAPMLIRPAGGKVMAVEGAGRWPAATRAEDFVTVHRGRIPKGAGRCVVPAAPDAWLTALARFGTMGFAELALPAADLARNGFDAHADLVACSQRFERNYRRYPVNAEIWLPGGKPIALGQHITQPALGSTLDRLIAADRAARSGGSRVNGLRAVRRCFYEGEIASAMADHVAANGGQLALSDLACHTTPVTEATDAPVQGGQMYCCGFWSQGPALIQALQILEASGPPADDAGFLHHLLSAIDLAFADREAHYGDPDFVTPPDWLLSPAYAATRAGLIDPEQGFDALPPAGDGPVATIAGIPHPEELTLDTSIVAIVDGDGGLFTCAPSDASFDAPAVPGLGFVVSTRGGQSHTDPSHPACVGPGRRPRVSAAPFIYQARSGDWTLGGGPGADLQLQAAAQVLARHLHHRVSLEEAVRRPRCFSASAPSSSDPHLCVPGQVAVEDAMDPDVIRFLERTGRSVKTGTAEGIARPSVCFATADRDGRGTGAIGDPRRASGQYCTDIRHG